MNLVNQDKIWRVNPDYCDLMAGTTIDDSGDYVETPIAHLNEFIKLGKQRDQISTVALSLKQTKILATLMPNIVLECKKLKSKSINHLLAVLLRVDISGFTKLSEICVQQGGEVGIFKLTNILNSFLGGMTTMIYEHGGDVWKFAGDSILSIWKVESTDIVSYVVYRAVRCALLMQQNLGYFDTGFKVVLRLKIGLAIGNVLWTMVGHEFSMRHVMVGVPVNEVRDADHFASSGDVIVAASMWVHMCPYDFNYDIIQEGRYVKIFDMISYMGNRRAKNLRTMGAPGFEAEAGGDKPNKHKQAGRVFPDLSDNKSMGPILRHCLLEPVVQQIDADLSLDFLTEMRVLTVMFVHILPQNLLNTELLILLDKAYNIIQGLVQITGGFVDKICLFDKDIMFVCFFGLRGLYQADEVARYLSCGHCIREACRSVYGIVEVSIGVTTSNIFIGVIGNDMYQNCTVIGPAANLAARMMCAYPGQITCDAETRKNSAFLPCWFVNCPTKQMRNISIEVNIFEFVGQRSRRLKLIVEAGKLPMLGRESEIDEFSSILNNPDERSSGIVIEGEHRSGKTRLLNDLILVACERGLQVAIVGLHEPQTLFPYFAAMHILTQVLRLGSGKQRENALFKLLSPELPPEDLKFIPIMCGMIEQEPVVNDSMKRIFITALQKGLEATILALDDLDLCDPASWLIIMAALESNCKLMIFTVQNVRAIPDTIKSRLIIQKLKPLSPDLLAAVACHSADAGAIHNRVLRFLLKVTQGSAGKCNSTMKMLLDQNLVDVVEIDETKVYSANVVVISPHILQKQVHNCEIWEPFTEWYSNYHELPAAEMLGNFTYRDFQATLEVLRKQGLMNSTLSPQEPSQAIMSNMYTFRTMITETLHTNADEIVLGKSQRETAAEDTDIFIDLFGSRKILKDPIRPMPFVAFEKGIDDIFLEEAISNFITLKEQTGKSLVPTGDIQLDTLRRHHTSCEINVSATNSPNKVSVESLDEELDLSDLNTIRSTQTEYGGPQRLSIRQLLKRKSTKSDTLSGSSKTQAGSESARFIRTIIMRPGVNLDEDANKPDSYMDLLAIFDSLRPFEQLLLKCCSVIGNKFSRAMVDELLHHPDPTFTSTATSVPGRAEEIVLLLENVLSSKLPDWTFCTCRNLREKTLDEILGHCHAAGLLAKQISFRIAKAEYLVTVGEIDAGRRLLKNTLKKCKTTVLGHDKNYILARISVCFAEIDIAENYLQSAARNIKSATSRIKRLRWDPFGVDFVKMSAANKLFMKVDIAKAGPVVARALNILATVRLARGEYKEVRKICGHVIKLHEHCGIADIDLARCFGLLMDASLCSNKMIYDKEIETSMIENVLRMLSYSTIDSGIAALRLTYVIANIRALYMGSMVDALDLMLGVKHLAQQLPVRNGLAHVSLDVTYLLMGRLRLREAAPVILSLSGEIDEIMYHATCLNYYRSTGFWIEQPKESIQFLTQALSGETLDSRSHREGVVALWLWYLYTKPSFAAEWEEKMVFHSSPELPVCTTYLFLMCRETWSLILQLHYSNTRSPIKAQILAKRLARLKKMSKTFRYLLPWVSILKAHYYMWLSNDPSTALEILDRGAKTAIEIKFDLLLMRIQLMRECWLRGVQPKPFLASSGGDWTQMNSFENSAINSQRA